MDDKAVNVVQAEQGRLHERNIEVLTFALLTLYSAFRLITLHPMNLKRH